MNIYEKELQKILNREKIEKVDISNDEIVITTEDKEITFTIISEEHLHHEIRDREFIE